MSGEHTIRLGKAQHAIFAAEDRFLNIEGAFRSAKTWTCLIKLRLDVERHPGIRIAIARWTEDGLHQKLIPDWRNVCALLNLPVGSWNPTESCYDYPNGSRVYGVHLKSSQIDNRYSKVRGLTVAKLYIDQLEEVPEDVYDEAALRLSQPGYPQQIIVSPNPVHDSHWIARRWPVENTRPQHRLIQLSVWDNKHNLSPETISAAEGLYPIGHPARRTKLEGRRGLDVKGTPVYAGAFVRSRHVQPVPLNPGLPLLESYDYGFRHPCVIFAQAAPWGEFRLLGGVMGSNLHLDAFLPIVERYRAKWFGQVSHLQATCDPAGAANNSQGLRGTPIAMLRAWYQAHGQHAVVPVYRTDANMPERRWTANQRLATYMRRMGPQGVECFAVDPERWVLAGANEVGVLDERFDGFCLDGLEVGYVLEDDSRHSSRLGTYTVPKKDGWFEHAQNCIEYHVQQSLTDLPTHAAAPQQRKDHERALVAAREAAEREALRIAQHDDDDDPWSDQADGTVALHVSRAARSRAGY